MRRGEIWTVSGGGNYMGKPRPAVILQDDSFDATASITLCVFTSDPTDAPLFRLVIEPTVTNGLRTSSRLIGRLDDADVLRLNQAVLVFLGLASPPRKSG